MNRAWVKITDRYIVVADFGEKGDIAVELTFKKNEDKSVTLISEKQIGKAEDFTEKDFEDYKIKKELEIKKL